MAEHLLEALALQPRQRVETLAADPLQYRADVGALIGQLGALIVESLAVKLHLLGLGLGLGLGLLWLCLLWPCLHGHVGELDELNLVVLVLVGDVEQLLDALLVS